jgi:hypothetical protein
MTNRKEPVDRRKHERFGVPIGIYVSFRSRGARLGEVINISQGGLAFRYMGGKEPSDGPDKLNIFLEEGGFHLNDVPFRTVTDFGTYQVPFTSVTMRQSGVQFGELTRHQMSQLEGLIQKHTTVKAT